MKTNYQTFDPTRDDLDNFLIPALDALMGGRAVVMPTETVYGVGALMLSSTGLNALFELKGRSKDKPLAVLVSSIHQVALIAKELPPIFHRLAKAFLPGPLTVIVKAKPGLSPLVTMNGTIAIRFSSHMMAQRLVQLAGAPLALTSANISGLPSVVRGSDAYEELGGRVDTILDDGVVPLGFESTIISIADPDRPKLLREGIISRNEVEEVIGIPVEVPTVVRTASDSQHRACYYVSSVEEIETLLSKKAEKVPSLVVDSRYKAPQIQIKGCDIFQLKENNLYILLRQIRRSEYTSIFVITTPDIDKTPLLRRKLQQIH